jgi:hypothetical protein
MIRTAFPRRHLPGSGQAADSPATARDALSGLPGAAGTGELLMTTRMHAHTDRIRNLEIAGGTFGPDAAGLDGPGLPPPSTTRRRPHLHTHTDHPHLPLTTGSALTGGTPRRSAVTRAGEKPQANHAV